MAQPSSEAHVVIGTTGTRLGATGGCHSSPLADEGFEGTTGVISRTGCDPNALRTALVFTQFNDGSRSSLDGRAATATQKNATAKKIPANLNTLLLCGMKKPTQAVSFIYDIRFTIDATRAGRRENRISQIVNSPPKFCVLAVEELRRHHLRH